MAATDLDIIVVELPGPQSLIGLTIAELKLPPGSVITLITRGKDLLVPKGSTQLCGWDQVSVLAHANAEETIRAVLLSALSSTSHVKTHADHHKPIETNG